MSDLQSFFSQNAELESVVEFVVSKRFKKNGEPIVWKLRTITEDENTAIRKSATRMVKGKSGARVSETDPEEYLSKLAAASVIYPELKDSELQHSYGVMGAESLIRKMLLAGEYAALLQKVQEINGFDADINEVAAEIKN